MKDYKGQYSRSLMGTMIWKSSGRMFFDAKLKYEDKVPLPVVRGDFWGYYGSINEMSGWWWKCPYE